MFTAQNGLEAVDATQKESIDIELLDIDMPIFNGNRQGDVLLDIWKILR